MFEFHLPTPLEYFAALVGDDDQLPGPDRDHPEHRVEGDLGELARPGLVAGHLLERFGPTVARVTLRPNHSLPFSTLISTSSACTVSTQHGLGNAVAHKVAECNNAGFLDRLRVCTT